jgi:glutamate dehydrogenase/leucine dehydrogenase
MSDSAGYIYDADGIDADKLAFVMELKMKREEESASMLRNIQTLNILMEHVPNVTSHCLVQLKMS